MVAVHIKSNGRAVSNSYNLLYLDIKWMYNRIPYAELGFVGGDVARQEFAISESGDFEPGKEVVIEMGYFDGGPANQAKPVFKGLVMKQSLQMNSTGCQLQVELVDEAFKMTTTRMGQVFENMKDSAIFQKLVQAYGLRAGTIGATTVQHKKMVQYASTAWDFMLSRAEANGLLVSVKSGIVSATAPNLSGRPKAGFIAGIDELYDLEMEADARYQHSGVEAANWDTKGKRLTPAKKAKDFPLAQGNFKPSGIAKKVGGNSESLLSAVALAEGETQAWADGVMVRRRLALLRGRLKIRGTAALELGDLITIGGVGDRFSGKTLVTGVHHSYTAAGWVTNLQFGLAYNWFATQSGVSQVPAAGLLPVINGLQIGVVEKFQEDPEKLFRVKVSVPALQDPNHFLWARQATLLAGNQAGTFFQPEPGDEVILGFLNDDPRQPVILGAVHGGSNQPPLKAADKNPEKGIVTKSGIKLLLDDEKKSITLSTSDKNTLVINDKDKFIEIKDANQNVFKLSADGISLNSAKDVIIQSKGAIKMTASQKVEIKGAAIEIT